MIGDAGTGKTVGARIFCQDHDRRPVYIRLMPGGALTSRALLRHIAEPLGLPWEMHSRYDVLESIAADSLRRPRLLIFDEAQTLAKGDLIDVLRWLHDEGGHSFTLIGMHALDQALRKHGELAGRVALRYQLRLPTVAELSPLFEGFSADVLDRIYEETGGRMRTVMSLRRRLFELIEQRKWFLEDVTSRQVTTLAKHFLGARAA